MSCLRTLYSVLQPVTIITVDHAMERRKGEHVLLRTGLFLDGRVGLTVTAGESPRYVLKYHGAEKRKKKLCCVPKGDGLAEIQPNTIETHQRHTHWLEVYPFLASHACSPDQSTPFLSAVPPSSPHPNFEVILEDLQRREKSWMPRHKSIPRGEVRCMKAASGIASLG